MATEKEKRLNWKDACKFLGCSKSHFYRLVNSGELPAVRFGTSRGTLVKKLDCERYLRKWQDRVIDDVGINRKEG
jgi:excisionase family DNA binding protein